MINNIFYLIKLLLTKIVIDLYFLKNEYKNQIVIAVIL